MRCRKSEDEWDENTSRVMQDDKQGMTDPRILRRQYGARDDGQVKQLSSM